ncbi:hydrogenase nickel incorporation protein HypB [Collinsella stercoris]|uniref:hydrogenase nickel incorporation protein HypB n=1 Tax=Collinsella stercoris TaxID=147206 RepID=UPI0023F11A8E|nr:hydrogenase nickel incorporation protein HypB [Collinsella stercoris]MEE0612800.1 hydrogenase nickel incorporation protein HypB [Collinsella stercoris]
MGDVRVIEVKQSVFADNDRKADELRATLRERGTFLLNLMSSPGSGKTTTLMRTIEALKDELNIAVMEADIDSDVDARTILDTGVRAIQLHTGGMCHLDAYMTEQGLDELVRGAAEAAHADAVAGDAVEAGAECPAGSTDEEAVASSAVPVKAAGTGDPAGASVDLAILENVGNLVCPAEFDTGASANAMILSVPEGDDKPFKYPLMFSICDVVLVNKIDALPVFDTFSMERVREGILMRNPNATIIPISAKTGEGIDEWADWLRAQVAAWKASA